jgi:hypothetical protein
VIRYAGFEESGMGSLRSSTQKQAQERRASPRFRIQCPVSFHFEEGQGCGILGDISMNGARIDHAVPCPEPGTSVLLLLAPLEGFFPIQVSAKVVRETETGFAVAFMNRQPRLGQWLEMKRAGNG